MRRVATMVFLAACQSFTQPDSAHPVDTGPMSRDHGYALLYSTISDECDVENVLIINRHAIQVADLIKVIGRFARDTKSPYVGVPK